MKRVGVAAGWVGWVAGLLLGCSSSPSTTPTSAGDGEAGAPGCLNGECGQSGAPGCLDGECGEPEPLCSQAGCPERSTCVVTNGAAICEPWTCLPNQTTCDATGLVAQRCAGDGLSFVSVTDCTADGAVRCYLGECLPQLCEPGALFCEGQALRSCSMDGSSFALVRQCGALERCVEETGSCGPQVCTPGAKQCDGDVVSECDETGAGFEPALDCAADGEKCFEGACKPALCEAAYCKDGNVWSCMDAGTRSELDIVCTEQQHCANGSCQVLACTAGMPLCLDGAATVCAADGGGPVPGGSNCAASNQACVGGACVPIVCPAGEYFCSGGNPQLCNGTGTAVIRQSDACMTNEHCKAGMSTCQADACAAGAKLCQGTVATTCAADGSGPVPGTDCAATGKVCLGGDCLVPAGCTPNAYFCEGGNVHHCSADGLTASLTSTCAANQFCQPGTQYCLTDRCAAGAPLCNGDNITSCAADGSGPANAGTSCGAGKICESNTCKDVICALDALQCTSNDLYRCTTKGTAWTLEEDCSASLYCNGARSPAACEPLFCAAGANTCNGEKLATCAQDGWHYATTSSDCSTNGNVCTLAGSCAASAVDTVGNATDDNVLTSTFFGANIFHVDRARTLTKIEQYLTVSGTPTLRWLVYEGYRTGDAYPYVFITKIADVAVPSTAGTGFHQSGPINVQLEAGKYYLIGAIVPGPATHYWQLLAGGTFLSFGEHLDSLMDSAPTPQPSYSDFGVSTIRHYQRLTTSAAP